MADFAREISHVRPLERAPDAVISFKQLADLVDEARHDTDLHRSRPGTKTLDYPPGFSVRSPSAEEPRPKDERRWQQVERDASIEADAKAGSDFETAPPRKKQKMGAAPLRAPAPNPRRSTRIKATRKQGQ